MDVEQGTLLTILAVVVGGVIIPIVNGIKKTVVVNWVKPEFITFILAAGAAYGLTAWLEPGTPIMDVLQLALATTGVTSIAYRTVK